MKKYKKTNYTHDAKRDRRMVISWNCFRANLRVLIETERVFVAAIPVIFVVLRRSHCRADNLLHRTIIFFFRSCCKN